MSLALYVCGCARGCGATRPELGASPRGWSFLVQQLDDGEWAELEEACSALA